MKPWALFLAPFRSGSGKKGQWCRVKAVSAFVPHSATAVQKGGGPVKRVTNPRAIFSEGLDR